MTTRYLVRASQEDARALRQAIGIGRGTSAAGLTPRPPAGRIQPVVVQLLADIDADDGSPHDAAIMTLVGDVWTDTMSRISIRNVSTGRLLSGDRHIATPCGPLGFCVESFFEA